MKRAKHDLSRLARLVAALLWWLPWGLASAAEPLTLVLNWVPGADHAPFFFALREGWYAQAGIALTIDSVAGSPEAVKRAARDPDTLAVSDFVPYLRTRGNFPDVTAVMVLQPRSPYAVYFSADSGIGRVQDLTGKRIAVQPQDPMRRLWPVLAAHQGISSDSVTWVDRSNAMKPDALAGGEADAAFNPFLHNHLNYAGALGPRMRVLWWHDIGFAAYGHVLVAGNRLTQASDNRLRNFVVVTQRAWARCLLESGPCISALLAAHPQLDRTHEEALWELVAGLYQTPSDASAPLGAFDPARDTRMLQDLQVAYDPHGAPRDAGTTNAFLDPQIRILP